MRLILLDRTSDGRYMAHGAPELGTSSNRAEHCFFRPALGLLFVVGRIRVSSRLAHPFLAKASGSSAERVRSIRMKYVETDCLLSRSLAQLPEASYCRDLNCLEGAGW